MNKKMAVNMKKNVLRKISEDRVMRKLVLLLGIVFVISSASAWYLLSYSANITTDITGTTEGLVIITDLDNVILNVSESLESTQDIELYNANGDVNMTYVLDAVFNKTDSLCNESGDIQMILTRNSSVIEEGIFEMWKNTNLFEFKIVALNPRICEGNFDITLTMSE